MANPEHLATLKKGEITWNAWREAHWEIKVDLIEADLSGVILGGVYGPNLHNADLSRAHLIGADLTRADLRAATLSGADLRAATLSAADLSKADLRAATLVGANCSGGPYAHPATLSHANFKGANLGHANLEQVNLSHANFEMANLSGADLIRVDLSGADLTRAHLAGANLSGAKLKGADFSKAGLLLTVFGDVDLSSVTGLESCQHYGPSIIDHRTLGQSDPLPIEFLHGCGVPDNLITYIKSLIGSGVEFYSCFISYSTMDQDFADHLYADLQAIGVRCWFAPHDVQAGRKLHEQIDEAIRLHDKLLLILSPHSMASEWVMTEISKARKREVRDKTRVLFPISLAPFEAIRDWEAFDADTGKDSAREIREYFIPDFSNWKDHASYQNAFERLLKDLRAASKETEAAARS